MVCCFNASRFSSRSVSDMGGGLGRAVTSDVAESGGEAGALGEDGEVADRYGPEDGVDDDIDSEDASSGDEGGEGELSEGQEGEEARIGYVSDPIKLQSSECGDSRNEIELVRLLGEAGRKGGGVSGIGIR